MNPKLLLYLVIAVAAGSLAAEHEIYPGDPADFDLAAAEDRLQRVTAARESLQPEIAKQRRELQQLDVHQRQARANHDRLARDAARLDAQVRQLQQQQQELQARINRSRPPQGSRPPRDQQRLETLRQQRQAAAVKVAKLTQAEQQAGKDLREAEQQLARQCPGTHRNPRCRLLRAKVDEAQRRHQAAAQQLQAAVTECSQRDEQIAASERERRSPPARGPEPASPVNAWQTELERVTAQLRTTTAACNQLNAELEACDRQLRADAHEQRRAQAQLDDLLEKDRYGAQAIDVVRGDLARVRRNHQRVIDHVRDAAIRYGIQGAREGRAFGQQDGAEAGRRAGNELGRQQGLADGETQALLQAAVAGKEDGSARGLAAAEERGRRDGGRDGRAAGLRRRGYNDGYAAARANPDLEDPIFKQAWQQGRSNAYRQAAAVDYAQGQGRADREFQNAELVKRQLDNRQAPPATAAASAPAIDSRPQTGPDPEYLRPTPAPHATFESRLSPVAPDQLPGHQNFADVPARAPELRNPQRALARQPEARPNREPDWLRLLGNETPILYPTADLQAHFEADYHQAFCAAASEAYQETFADAYAAAFADAARGAYDDFSDLRRFNDRADATEADAAAYWEQRLLAERYPAVYDEFYRLADKEAAERPDPNDPGYRQSYRDGLRNALIELGQQQGFDENATQARQDEEARGHADRVRFYSENASLQVLGSEVSDTDGDGIFAPGEPFSFSIAVRNIGKRSQAAGALTAHLTIIRGPGETITEKSEVAAVPPQSETAITQLLSARLLPHARQDDVVRVSLTVQHAGAVLLQREHEIQASLPLRLQEVRLPATSATNAEQQLTATVVNTSRRLIPAGAAVELTGTGLRQSRPIRLGALEPGGEQQLSLTYRMDDRALFDTSALTLQVLGGEVVLGRAAGLQTVVTKRFIPQHRVLLYIDADADLRGVRDALLTAALPFDLCDRRWQGQPAGRDLARYRDGLVIATIGRASADSVGLLTGLYRLGAETMVFSDSFSDDRSWSEFFNFLQIDKVKGTDGGRLRGAGLIDGIDVSTDPREITGFRVDRSSSHHSNYDLLTGPGSWLFGRPIVALRHIDRDQGAVVNLFGFGADRLSAPALGRLVARTALASLPIEQLAATGCQASGDTLTDARQAALTVLDEEMDTDDQRRHRLYNPKYADVSQTALHRFIVAVVDRHDCPARRQLTSLYVPLSAHAEDSRHARAVLAPLGAAHARGGY